MKKTVLLSLLLVIASAAVASDQRFVLSREQWNVPRSVDTVLQMTPLREAMQRLNEQPAASLRLRYPGGDEGTLWASEVRSWLIALGLGSERIEVLPGSRERGTLEIEILTPTIGSSASYHPPGLR